MGVWVSSKYFDPTTEYNLKNKIRLEKNKKVPKNLKNGDMDEVGSGRLAIL